MWRTAGDWRFAFLHRLLHFTDVIRNLGVHIQTLHYAYETTDPGLYTTSVFGQSLHETQTQDPLAWSYH